MPYSLVTADYRRAIGEFIASPSEAGLEVAYVIGRDALQGGLSLGDLRELHYCATRDLIADERLTLPTLGQAEEFFLQIASVYDMALRGYRETIKQLRVEVAERRKTEQQLHETALALARERDLLQQRVAERTETLRIQADELTRRNEELKRRNSQLDDFAHIAAHDLREPLRSISTHASILMEESAALNEETRHRLGRLMTLTARMEQLVGDLLRYSNLEHAGQTVETVDLMEVMAGIEATLADTLQMRDARIRLAGRLPAVRGNRVLLTSLFQNLISNGTKYSDAPEKVVEIGSVPNSEPDGFDVLYVRDNGIGIEEQFHDEVFRLFKRLNSEKTYGKGTGAGLTFVKKIVEIHGGRIWLTSRSGEGTTFYFTLMKSR